MADIATARVDLSKARARYREASAENAPFSSTGNESPHDLAEMRKRRAQIGIAAARLAAAVHDSKAAKPSS